jgi:hypothetical protein
MRKLVVLGIAVALFMSLAAVAASAAPPGKTFDRQPTPEAVTYEHIDALNDCDIDRLMAQYPESIHIIVPGGGTFEGRDVVRDLFIGFCQDYPDGFNGITFTEVEHWKVHKTINMQWVATADFLCEPYYGADAYETWAGLMAAQVTTFDPADMVLRDPTTGECP